MSERTRNRAISFSGLVSSCVFAAALLMPGCNNDDLDGVSEEHIAVAESYLEALNTLDEVLSTIQNQSDARDAVGKVESTVTEIADLHKQIAGMPPKSRRAVNQNFSGRFAFAKQKINHQAVRVLSQAETGRSLRAPLAPVARYVR